MPPIYFAADHAGFTLKQQLIDHIKAMHTILIAHDLGTYNTVSIDYPDIAQQLALRIKETGGRGVLLCGSGIGMSIAANRYPYIRAALCHDLEYVRLARQHNDANVLVLGARYISAELAGQMLDTFLQTEFLAGRHAQRVAKLLG
jgi:ribose 5-phosphate isomerase B